MVLISAEVKAQFYTPIQIQTIHDNKQAYEGDMYLDTVNKDYYIGITTGELKIMSDDQGIDSIRILMPQRELVIYISNGDADTVEMDPANDVWIDVNGNILSRNSQSQTLNGTNNLALGYEAMTNGAGASSYKMAIGYQAGRYDVSVGDVYVTELGTQSGYNNQGKFITAFGYQSLYNNTGNVVTGIGSFAGFDNTGDSSFVMGYQSAYNGKGSNNLAIGSYSLRDPVNASNYITAIGYQAVRFDSTIGDSYLTAYGTNAMYLNKGKYINAMGNTAAYRNKGHHNTMVGSSSGQENRGSYSTFYGYQSGYQNKGDNNLAIGMYTLRDARQKANFVMAIGQYASRLDSSEGDAYNSFIGYYAGYQNKSKQFVGIGYRSGYNNRASRVTALGPNVLFEGKGEKIVAVGNSAGYTNEGSYLVAFGHVAARNNRGMHNLAIGMYTYYQGLKANHIVALGHYAASRDSSLGDAYVNSIGYYTGHNNKGTYVNAFGSRSAYNNTGDYISNFGYQTGRYNTGNHLVAFGAQAGFRNKGDNNVSLGTINSYDKVGDGSELVSIGQYASRYDSVNGISQSNVIGYYAGYANAGRGINTVGSNSAYFNRNDSLNAFGYQAGYSNKGKNNIAIGSYAMSVHAGEGNYITAIGHYAARYDSTLGDAFSIAIGIYSNYYNKGKFVNTLGYQSGFRSNGDHHNLIGHYVQYDKVYEGKYNNGIGFQALRIDSTEVGYVNAIGYSAGYRNTGDYAVLIGANAGNTNKGAQTVAIGTNAMYSNSGEYNIAIGYQAGYRPKGHNNIYLGTNAGVYHEEGDKSIFIGNSAGRSSIFSKSNSLYISNANNVATLYADLDVKNVGVNTLVPDNNLSVNGSAGKTGGGLWAVFSDKRLKKEIKTYKKGIESLALLNTYSFQYNEDYESKVGLNEQAHNKVYQGVIAQELVTIFPEMVSESKLGEEDYLQVDPSDFTYILINTLKKQEEEITLLEEQLELLKKLAKVKSQKL